MDRKKTGALTILLILTAAVFSTDSKADISAGAYVYKPNGDVVDSSVGGYGSALFQNFGEDGAFVRGVAQASSEMGVLKVGGNVGGKTNSTDFTNTGTVSSRASATFGDWGAILEIYDREFLEGMQSNPYVTPIIDVTFIISVDSLFSLMLSNDSPYGGVRTSGGFSVSFNQWLNDYQRSYFFRSGTFASQDTEGYLEINSSSNNFDVAPLNSFDGVYEFTIPIIPFIPFDFSVNLSGEASGRDSTAWSAWPIEPVYFGSFSASYELDHSLYWGGVGNILDQSGSLISDYSFNSMSGFDYTKNYAPSAAAVPEPGALELLMLGLIALFAGRRKTERPVCSTDPQAL